MNYLKKLASEVKNADVNDSTIYAIDGNGGSINFDGYGFIDNDTDYEPFGEPFQGACIMSDFPSSDLYHALFYIHKIKKWFYNKFDFTDDELINDIVEIDGSLIGNELKKVMKEVAVNTKSQDVAIDLIVKSLKS